MVITFLFFSHVLNCSHHNSLVSLNRCYCFCFQVGKQVQKGGVHFPKPHSKGQARIREPLPISFGPWWHLHRPASSWLLWRRLGIHHPCLVDPGEARITLALGCGCSVLWHLCCWGNPGRASLGAALQPGPGTIPSSSSRRPWHGKARQAHAAVNHNH